MLFTGLEVCMGKNCARGLSRPGAQFFSHTDQPSPVDNIFIFVLLSCSTLSRFIGVIILVQSFFHHIVKFAFTVSALIRINPLLTL